MAAELRDYQVRALEDVRAAFRSGARAVLLTMACGAGKTTVVATMLRGSVERGHRSIFLAHRQELIDQASDRLHSLGVPHGILMADRPQTPGAAVVVASVQTLARRRDLPPCDLLAVDEAHRTLGPSYLRLIEKLQPRYIVGITATPSRTDGQGLGAVYDVLVQGPTTAELTPKWLVPADLWSHPTVDMRGAHRRAGEFAAEDVAARVARPSVMGDVVATWRARADGRRTVAFGVSVEHAVALRDAWRGAGVRAEVLTGETPTTERHDMLAALADGTVTVVASCATLTEGYDNPAIECASIVRPTLSPVMFRQMCGRVLRQSPGKDRAIILDHGGNAARHGHIYAPEAHSLTSEARKLPREGEQTPGTSVCRMCFAVYLTAGAGSGCPMCGAAREVNHRRLIEKQGELERVDWAAAPLAQHDDNRATKAARALAARARERGYARGWLYHQLRLRYGEGRARALLREVAA